MKKIIISVVFCLAFSISALAQTTFPELDKIKQIKLLESTRADVKRIFGEYQKASDDNEDSIENEDSSEVDEDEDEDVETDEISTKNMVIRFHYSLGTCSDEEEEEEWNVPKGVVTEINVIFRNSLKAKDLKIDLSKFERIKEHEDDENDETDEDEEEPDDFIYYDKDKNVSYGLSDDEIQNIKFTPSEKNFPALCNNETVRESVSNREWLLKKLRERPYLEIREGFASVVNVILSKNEFTIDCPANDSERAEVDFDYAKIDIETKSSSSDVTDVLVYNYTVSGGVIVGTGANVVWDLSGVAPGEYKITAGVDNGCGICGTTKTETVIIREPSCSQKEK